VLLVGQPDAGPGKRRGDGHDDVAPAAHVGPGRAVGRGLIGRLVDRSFDEECPDAVGGAMPGGHVGDQHVVRVAPEQHHERGGIRRGVDQRDPGGRRGAVRLERGESGHERRRLAATTIGYRDPQRCVEPLGERPHDGGVRRVGIEIARLPHGVTHLVDEQRGRGGNGRAGSTGRHRDAAPRRGHVDGRDLDRRHIRGRHGDRALHRRALPGSGPDLDPPADRGHPGGDVPQAPPR
jgi:hypothetical protein